MSANSVSDAIPVVEADVVVVGGGMAGLMAAIAAAEQGASVALLDKAHPRRSGGAASGLDHLSVLVEPEKQMPRFLKRQAEVCGGLTDPRLPALFRHSWDVLMFLENIGVKVRDSRTGELIWIAAPIHLGEKLTVSLEGGDLKIRLFETAVRRGVNIYARTMGTGLLTSGGRVVGATGLNVRDGTFLAFRARATVVATGAILRMYKAVADLRFNTHHCPYCTGDGQAMAYRAGAELVNMEMTTMQPSPKGYSVAGISGVVSMGAHFVNALGERFMARYDPARMEIAAKSTMALAFLTETKEGRAPLFVDFRHLTNEQRELLLRGFREERPTILEYFGQKNIDIAQQPVEFELHEYFGGQGPGGGIKLAGESCESTVPGLFAAGDCTGGKGWPAAMGAMILGQVAGRNAAAYSRQTAPTPVDDEQVLRERERVFVHLDSRASLRWQEVEDKLKRVMSDYVGASRSEVGLKIALQRIAQLGEDISSIGVRNYHELGRALEVANLVEVSRLIAAAALERKESRLAPFHFRSDYPATDDANWLGFVVLRRENGEDVVSFERID
ncbi:MAG: FAD-dependent oxidoreductase [Chloroflexi bacterium]|nr:FAD-dependent oxidoreductase [Chloroflexota bacterium]